MTNHEWIECTFDKLQRKFGRNPTSDEVYEQLSLSVRFDWSEELYISLCEDGSPISFADFTSLPEES